MYHRNMGLLDLLFPERCVNCGKLGKYLCRNCLARIEYISQQICPVCHRSSIDAHTHFRCRSRYSIDGLFAAAHYKGPVKKAIKRLKFGLVSHLVETLVAALFSDRRTFFPRLDLLVPVPLHFRRERERGFNQSGLIAVELGRRMGIPYRNLLVREKYTLCQAGLGLDQRRENVRGVFSCKINANLKGLSVGLVDDVSTTGFTLLECARVLKKKGAGMVWGIVLAHGN